MSAQFILSFDCEGLWGVADELTAEHRRTLTNERLDWAYRAIVQLLDEYRVEATFAFVGAFAQSPAQFARIRPAVEAMRQIAPAYLDPVLRELDEGSSSGWHGDQLVELVSSARTQHEVALHGVTHVPWTDMDARGVESEMVIFEALSGPVRESRTFVYPRNLIGHENVLPKHGFAGFRAARPARSRVHSLLSEFDVFAAPEKAHGGEGIIRIPAGFFLNWRRGVRALVPPVITRMRVRHLLRAAARRGGIVHYWLHPENIATAPATLPLLRMLVREVADARDAGHCQIRTQLGYCADRESLP